MNTEDHIIQRYREAIAAPREADPWESLSNEEQDLWRKRWGAANESGCGA